jgi:hypothetical protein
MVNSSCHPWPLSLIQWSHSLLWVYLRIILTTFCCFLSSSECINMGYLSVLPFTKCFLSHTRYLLCSSNIGLRQAWLDLLPTSYKIQKLSDILKAGQLISGWAERLHFLFYCIPLLLWLSWLFVNKACILMNNHHPAYILSVRRVFTYQILSLLCPKLNHFCSSS